MTESTRKAVGNTSIPVQGLINIINWGQGPAKVTSSVDKIKAEHINSIRSAIEALSMHTHNFSNDYLVPIEPPPLVVTVPGGAAGEAPITDILGVSGSSDLLSGITVKWGQASTNKSTVPYVTPFQQVYVGLATASLAFHGDGHGVYVDTLNLTDITIAGWSDQIGLASYVAIGRG